MPNLEPDIEAQFKWENPDTQNGKKTLPIGPIRWEARPDGEMQAWGVGSQNGQPRRQLIFTIPKPVGWKTAAQPNTPAFEKGDPLTTVGTATQPPDASEQSDETPPSFSSSDSAEASPAQSAAPIQTTLPIREGTSETRYAQQDHTHASGQLAEGTPHAAVNDHGHGDKSVTMEPNTIGQAPKENPLPEPEQPPAPGYIDQAKQAAAAASATVTSTVGSMVGAVTGSGSKPEAEKVEEPVRVKSPTEKELDGKIDASNDQNVEAFLRQKHNNQ